MPKWSWTVDRIEGEWVVVEASVGRTVQVPRSTLPSRTREGDVLQFEAVADEESAAWKVSRDAASTKERQEAIDSLHKDLKRRDPGGDVVL